MAAASSLGSAAIIAPVVQNTGKSEGGPRPLSSASMSTAGPAGASLAPEQGAVVLLDGTQWRVQYVTSRGLLDLRSEDGGDVRYGVAPSKVTLVPTADATVRLDGTLWRVQYVTSRGLLDLRSEDGSDVRYGVDASAVALVSAAPREQSLPAAAAAPAAEEPPLPPADLPVCDARLELLAGEPLGTGGSGARVVRCHLDGGTEELAAKLLPWRGSFESKRDDMLEELRLCADLAHASIVRFALLAPVLHVAGVPYLAMVMECVPVTLANLIDSRRAASPAPRPFSARRLGAIFGELADALDYLHARPLPILHRDVKPLNICFAATAIDDDARESGGP